MGISKREFMLSKQEKYEDEILSTYARREVELENRIEESKLEKDKASQELFQLYEKLESLRDAFYIKEQQLEQAQNKLYEFIEHKDLVLGELRRKNEHTKTS